MIRPEPTVSRYRVVVLGSDAALARRTLHSLVACGIRPAAVVVEPKFTTVGPSSIPVRVAGGPESLQDVAALYGLPIVPVPTSGRCPLADTLQRLKPDVVLVTCFPRRLSKAARQAAGAATLNLHPSLLPAYRGPHPLFWQRRAGLHEVGITLHAMDEGLDSGAIWRQAPCPLPDGVDFATANELLGRLGAELFVAAVAEYGAGRLKPQPQDAGHATYQGMPGMEDFRLSTDWSARHAFNFVRLAGHWGLAFPVRVGGNTLMVGEALDFRTDVALGRPYRTDGDNAAVQFSPGVMYARVRAP